MASTSKSLAALRVALEGAASTGAKPNILDLRELDLPMYNPENDDPTPAAARLIELSHSADGMLWSSPMYQGTISGAFKNALDWLHLLRDSDPPFLYDKVVGLISAAGGTQGLQAINRDQGASSLGRAVRCSGCGCSKHFRPSRSNHGWSSGAAAQDARRRSRPRRRAVRCRPRTAS